MNLLDAKFLEFNGQKCGFTRVMESLRTTNVEAYNEMCALKSSKNLVEDFVRIAKPYLPKYVEVVRDAVGQGVDTELVEEAIEDVVFDQRTNVIYFAVCCRMLPYRRVKTIA